MQKISFYNVLLILLLLASCNDDDEVTPPLSDGQTILVRNTLQIEAPVDQGGTGGNEVPVEVVFGAPDGLYNLSTTISSAIEFDDYLEGLYDINFTNNSVSFNLVAAADHPIYQNFFRTIEANTFDRYYFTFPEGHQIRSFSSSEASVRLNVISDNEVVIEIGEGWNFNPGSNFTITFN